MALDIIGAGFGRTGTLSLKHALEQLGFNKCYHMMEVMNHPDHNGLWRAAGRGEAVDWEALFAGYRASVDWPSCNFWREQMQAFPAAKVILSLRDAESWYESIMNTIWKVSDMIRKADAPESRERTNMVFELIWDGQFQRRLDDKAHVISVFEKHNQTVIDSVPKEKLLVYRPGDGWEPLCGFLGCPIPSTPYPKMNSTEDFQKFFTQPRSG
jgi:Sulfotransferase domain